MKLYRLLFVVPFVVLIFSMRGNQGFSYGKALAFFSRSTVPSWTSPVKGLEYREVSFEGEGSGSERALRMVRFDQDFIKVRILYAHDYGATAMTVKELAEKSGAIAAINGGYFDEYDKPLGYLKVKGREVNDYIATPIIYSGMLSVRNGKASIFHRDTFHPASCDEALQAGPRLVYDGIATTGVERTIDYKKEARRAGIAIDKKGRVVAFITSPPSAEMNWKDLRTFLMRSEKEGGIEPKDVMNLDGGSSTQLIVKAGKLSKEEGYAKVPVVIGFFRK
jgi:exopolysaccharide biosynthesis protein